MTSTIDDRLKEKYTHHDATGALVADVSCVLLHYPFVSTFAKKVQEAVRTRHYGPRTSDEYDAYADALARNPRLSLMRPSARRFTVPEPLIAGGFLVVPDEYRPQVDAVPED